MTAILGQEKLSAMIIGGSGGIGRAISRSLATICGELWIHGGNDALRLQSLAAELESANRGLAVHAWVEPFIDCAGFCQSLPAGFVPDVLVVAYGPLVEGSIADMSPESWSHMAAANLALPGALVSRYAPLMAHRGRGAIFLFGGTGTDTIRAYREVAAYAAAKTGLGVLVKSAAKEFGAGGVLILGLCPGYVETEYVSAAQRQAWSQRMTEGKLQKPEVFGNLVIEILSMDDNMVFNGSMLMAEGISSAKNAGAFDKAKGSA